MIVTSQQLLHIFQSFVSNITQVPVEGGHWLTRSSTGANFALCSGPKTRRSILKCEPKELPLALSVELQGKSSTQTCTLVQESTIHVQKA
jgi:hypothetical protein